MPIYEYRCNACGRELEKLQKISDPALKDCPECGEAALVKLVSASSFRLKGTGWYETDFKNNSKKKAENRDENKSVEGKTVNESTSADKSENKDASNKAGKDKADNKPKASKD